MPSSPLPPYDVIIFFAVWVITAVSWIVSYISRTRGCCCCGCCSDNLVCTILCGQAQDQQDDSGSASNKNKNNNSNDDQHHHQPMTAKIFSSAATEESKLGGSGDAALHMLGQDAAKQNNHNNNPTSSHNNIDSSSPSSSSASSSLSPTMLIVYRLASSVVLSFLIAFILTMIIMAILGSVGFLDALLFSPAASSTCSSSCTFTTKDGISGWVDESCCTYSPTGIAPKDVFLRFRDPSNAANSLSDFTIHGWLMVNATRHHSAPASQKPLIIMYSHGSGNNVAAGYRIERYKFLLEQGNVVVISYDYAGYGKSTGTANTESVLASAKGVARYLELYLSSFTSSTDLQTSINYQQSSSTSGVVIGTDVPLGASITDPLVVDLPANNGGLVNMSEIVVLGRSLGGAVTTATVTKSASVKPKAMILQSTFSRMQDLSSYYFPMFFWAWAAFFSEYDDLANVDNIKNFVPNKCLYHAHSKEDEWVPFSEAEEIQAAAQPVINSACSQWVIVQNAIHTQPLTLVERETLGNFLKSSHVH